METNVWGYLNDVWEGFNDKHMVVSEHQFRAQMNLESSTYGK